MHWWKGVNDDNKSEVCRALLAYCLYVNYVTGVQQTSFSDHYLASYQPPFNKWNVEKFMDRVVKDFF